MVALNNIKLIKNSSPLEFIYFKPTKVKRVIISKYYIKINEIVLKREEIIWVHWLDNIRILETYFGGIIYK